ncbi:transcriptional regulator, TetR family [Bacteriovorax sp. BAL6_X]|uniref:TetR/AcrR family transcriptional regulator n=1 Tax=Bacteriovorax sp. BAL6_X TaxID=1201290 RepID=UPI0003869E99|nr:TetR/AcrR family transcriptional regulator [Bacteriovorax sp. BAL6_X]EPZ49710.1 transcriptional regulator, TetR family [Bacteriovorax sp. BAL6_X]
MKQDSKEAIFEGVLELLNEEAILDISVSKLKKHTGLSTGTFYYHFPGGIEDIYKSLFIKLSAKVRNRAFVAASNAKSIEQTLNDLVCIYFGWHKHEVRESDFFWKATMSGFQEIRELLVSEYEILSTKIYEVLKKQAELENTKIVDRHILDAILFGAARELVHSWIGRGRDEEEYDLLKEQFIKTLNRACVIGSYSEIQ